MSVAANHTRDRKEPVERYFKSADKKEVLPADLRSTMCFRSLFLGTRLAGATEAIDPVPASFALTRFVDSSVKRVLFPQIRLVLLMAETFGLEVRSNDDQLPELHTVCTYDFAGAPCNYHRNGPLPLAGNTPRF